MIIKNLLLGHARFHKKFGSDQFSRFDWIQTSKVKLEVIKRNITFATHLVFYSLIFNYVEKVKVRLNITSLYDKNVKLNTELYLLYIYIYTIYNVLMYIPL